MMKTRIMNGTSTTSMWDRINWSATEREVKNLQFRIFVAKRDGNRRKLRRLQKLLFKSRSNVRIALRRVLVRSSGKFTPGVDRVTVTKSERMALQNTLLKMDLRDYMPKPVKRVFIPKRNGKVRPLGIPTITDRCLQAMVKNCLEPEWEVAFESSSYGFRPGRSPHDALGRLYNVLSVKKHGSNHKVWILDAGIESFFDRVNHDDLLKKLDNYPHKYLIERWLKAGVMALGKFHPTDVGTPQGSVISPLLANIVLTDLATYLGTEPDSTGRVRGSRVLVRFADDFVVLCSSLREARRTLHEINAWLRSKGLKIAQDKTRIVHVDDGFDFLGVNVKHYKTNALKKTRGKVLLMQPSKGSLVDLKRRLKQEWHSLRGKPPRTVVYRLNPIIRGWANYFKYYVSTNALRSLSHWTHKKTWRHATRSHPNKGLRWVYNNYFGHFISSQKDRWVYGDKQSGDHLRKFTWTNRQRHTIVKGRHSVYDPGLKTYWAKRKEK